MIKNNTKLSKRQLAAQKRMDEALSEIISAANLYSVAEKDFYNRRPKAKRRLTILGLSK